MAVTLLPGVALLVAPTPQALVDFGLQGGFQQQLRAFAQQQVQRVAVLALCGQVRQVHVADGCQRLRLAISSTHSVSPSLGAVVAAIPVFSVPRGYDTLFSFTPLVGRYQPLDATMLPPNVGFIAPTYGAEITGDTIPVIIQAAGKYPIARLDWPKQVVGGGHG